MRLSQLLNNDEAFEDFTIFFSNIQELNQQRMSSSECIKSRQETIHEHLDKYSERHDKVEQYIRNRGIDPPTTKIVFVD